MAEKIPAKEGTYMDKPLLTIYLNNNELYRFSFGVGKARAILEYLDEIKQFVEKNEKKPDEKNETPS